mgnify:CR=1 FL=1
MFVNGFERKKTNICSQLVTVHAYVPSKEEADTRPEKYYTSIHLKDGDTLWSIAQTYCADSEESVEEYVRELRQMNSLSDDHIDAGHYLTIRYYK